MLPCLPATLAPEPTATIAVMQAASPHVSDPSPDAAPCCVLLPCGRRGVVLADARTPAQAARREAQGWPRQAGRPLADSSPWNTPIPHGARYEEVPPLGGYDIGLTSWLHTAASVALHRATVADPRVPIRWVRDSWEPVNTGRWARWGNPAQLEAEILERSEPVNRYPGNPYSTQHPARHWNSAVSGLPPRFARWRQAGELLAHVPEGALPPPDGDGMTVILQPDGRALELYSPVKLSSGAWVSQMFTLTDSVNGLGIGAENGRRASMVPAYAGVITEANLAAGRIPHALALMVPASLLAPAFVGPALAFDSDPNYSGSLPMGARLALPRDLDPGRLGVRSRLGRLIAEAARTYGMFVVDRGGEGVSIVTEHAPGSALLGADTPQERADLKTILRALRACRVQAGSAASGQDGWC